MDLRLTDEQRQLQETVARFVRKDYTFEQRREILAAQQSFSLETWRALADLGLLAVGIPEEHGGLGGNAIETMLVLEEFGRGLLLEPYVPSVVDGLVARRAPWLGAAARYPAAVGDRGGHTVRLRARGARRSLRLCQRDDAGAPGW